MDQLFLFMNINPKQFSFDFFLSAVLLLHYNCLSFVNRNFRIVAFSFIISFFPIQFSLLSFQFPLVLTQISVLIFLQLLLLLTIQFVFALFLIQFSFLVLVCTRLQFSFNWFNVVCTCINMFFILVILNSTFLNTVHSFQHHSTLTLIQFSFTCTSTFIGSLLRPSPMFSILVTKALHLR